MSPARRLYLDNSATSFPKPAAVLAALTDYAVRVGASAGRGAYAEAQESGRVIACCRQRLNTLFHGANPLHFIFTLNCTDALNLAILGLLRPGDHAITTQMEHNSVLRPLNALESQGQITVTRLPVHPVTCRLDPDDLRQAIRPNTRLIAVVHGSNVTGALQPIRDLGRIACEHDIPFLVDAAQTAGHVPIDVQQDGIDLLAAPGHKALLGPLGTGFLYIRPGLEKILRPIRYGGTGSVSEQDTQPDFMPDKYEPGSHNALGIAGLSAGLDWLLHKTVAAVWEHDRALTKTFLEESTDVQGLRLYGPPTAQDRMGVFSVRVRDVAPIELSNRLETEFGILTRPGLHCAPLAHEHLGTLSADPSTLTPDPSVGTTRLSFGPFLELPDVTYAAHALATIALETYAHPVKA